MREGFGRMERETKGEKRKGGKRKREKEREKKREREMKVYFRPCAM